MKKTRLLPFLVALSLAAACQNSDDDTATSGGTTGGETASDATGSASASSTGSPTSADEGDTADTDDTNPSSGDDSSSGGSGDGEADTSSGGEESGSSEGSTSTTGVVVIDADFYVDAEAGDDDNDGSLQAPFRTITAAMAAAVSGNTVAVFPGEYDAPHGEAFPIYVKPGVSLVGNTGDRGLGANETRILGNGQIDNDNSAALRLGTNAEVRGFAITSSTDLASFGIYVDVDATIAENTFDSSYGGVRLAGGGSDTFENTFATQSYGVYGCDGGTGVIYENHFVTPSLPVDIRGGGSCNVVDNLIEGSGQVGLQNQGGANLISSNVFEMPGGYQYGCFSLSGAPTLRDNECNVQQGPAVRLTTGAGAVDLGTFADFGGNTLGSDDAVGIVHLGTSAVQAVGNTWANGSVVCGVDIDLQSTGSVTYGFDQVCS